MKKLSLLFVFVFSVIALTVKAQGEAPSLQAGLNGITFSKGNLDAALIAEIIAEKQRELKTRLIKEMLLESLGVNNGLFYAYIDNTIDIIANEKDEKTRVRNLLENTVNLAFVTLYADYYLSTATEGSIQLHNLRKLAQQCNVDTNLMEPNISLRKLAKFKFDNTSYRYYRADQLSDEAKNMNTFIGVLLDVTAEAVRSNQKLRTLGLMRTSYFQNQSKTDAYKKFSNAYDNKGLGTLTQNDSAFFALYTKLNAAINNNLTNKTIKELLTQYKDSNYVATSATKTRIDNVYSTIKNDFTSLVYMVNTDTAYAKIKNEYDFNFTTSLKYSDNPFDSLFNSVYGVNPSIINNTGNYAVWSDLYHILDIKYKFDILSKIINQKSYADAVLDDESENLNLLLKYVGIIKTLASKGNNIESIWNVLEENYNCGNDSISVITQIENLLDSARKSIGNVATIAKTDIDAFTTVNGFLNKLKLAETNSYQYLAEYENEVKPALLQLSKYSQQYLTVQDLMFTRLFCFAHQAKDELNTLGLNLDNSFINSFSHIDEFDQPETYQNYLNQLADLGDIFSSEKMRNTINIVSSFVRSYLTVSQDTANRFTVNIDAEGFITSLQKLNYNKFSPWGLHFTVGTNTAAFNRPLTLGDGSTINNYSFVGEKIGVKFKLYDNQYLKSFSRGETYTYWRYGIPFLGKTTFVRNAPPSEPILSNVHLLAYGSGVLYNLANTGTTKDFNSPLVGAGIGLTFFNGLDINASIGTAVVSNKPFLDKSVPFYFNLGMDIQFVEYIDRLNQKRKTNQTQKKLAEAAKND